MSDDTFRIYESDTDGPVYSYANGSIYRQGGIVVCVAHGVTIEEAHNRLRAAHPMGYRLDVARASQSRTA